MFQEGLNLIFPGSKTGPESEMLASASSSTQGSPSETVRMSQLQGLHVWVVVKIVVPFGFPIIVRHLIFRVPKKGP